MKKLNLRRFTFRKVRLAFGSATSLAIGVLAFVPPVAHGEDVTVEFEGTIIGVCPVGFPFPAYSCFGYEIDPQISVGTTFSGSYTLSTTPIGAWYPLNTISQVYFVWPTTGSIQIGTTLLTGSEDPSLGTQAVQIVNNALAAPLWESLDAWWLLPLQSDAITGGDHYCQIFFGESGTGSNPPQRLDGTDYFVNDSLDWNIFLPGAQQDVLGSFQCFGKSSAFVVGPLNPLFVGKITSIHRVVTAVEVGIDLKPGSDPNCVKTTSKASVPVAILGTGDLDVTQIDQSSLAFGGANPPQRCAAADLAPADGIPDLTCHFATSAVAWPAPGSVCGDVALTGSLLDGRAIEGADTACLAGESACY